MAEPQTARGRADAASPARVAHFMMLRAAMALEDHAQGLAPALLKRRFTDPLDQYVATIDRRITAADPAHAAWSRKQLLPTVADAVLT